MKFKVGVSAISIKLTLQLFFYVFFGYGFFEASTACTVLGPSVPISTRFNLENPSLGFNSYFFYKKIKIPYPFSFFKLKKLLHSKGYISQINSKIAVEYKHIFTLDHDYLNLILVVPSMISLRFFRPHGTFW